MADYTALIGKQVVVTRQLEDGTTETIHGTLEAASAVGAMVKPKGRARGILLEASEVLDITNKPKGPKKLRQKHLKPIPRETVRDHLIDRHGYNLEDIQNMSEEQAEEFHNSLDHAPLGHDHTRGQVEGAEEVASAESADEADEE